LTEENIPNNTSNLIMR
jgi:hypothetical protein